MHMNALRIHRRESASAADGFECGGMHSKCDKMSLELVRNYDGEHPGSGTASWDGAWCSFEHGGVSTLEQSHRLALHAP